jgi:hypothetical protein
MLQALFSRVSLFASALWRCFTALISSRQILLNGGSAGIK